MIFQVEEREDGRFNLWEIVEIGNNILRIGGSIARPKEEMPK